MQNGSLQKGSLSDFQQCLLVEARQKDQDSESPLDTWALGGEGGADGRKGDVGKG